MLCADAGDNEQSAQPSAAPAPAPAPVVGTDLDEEAQLELAMFLSMEEAKAAEATAKAAAAAASPSQQTAPEATQTAAAYAAADADQELPSPGASNSDQAGPEPVQFEVSNPLIEVERTQDPTEEPTEEVTGHDCPASPEHDPFAGSVHSELSSAGPARSPVATDSEPDTWQFLDDTPELTAAQSAATSDTDQAAAHADVPAAAAVPVGQAIAESLRSMTSTSSDLDGVPSAAVPTEQFAALSLVDTLASNPDGEDVQLQLETESSQFLQYCLDPTNGVLPQHTRSAVLESPPADNSHSVGTWADDEHELSSSPRDEGALGQAAANDAHVKTPVTVTGHTHRVSTTHFPESYAQPTPLSPRSQLHATALGGDVFQGSPSATAVDHGAFVVDDEDDVSSLVGGTGYQQHIWEPTETPHEADAPASIHVEQGTTSGYRLQAWFVLDVSIAL